jgi:hypothetical protein
MTIVARQWNLDGLREAAQGKAERGGRRSKPGQNGGGKGGRNYRLNWTLTPDGGAEFGEYSIQHDCQGTAHPYTVHYRGEPLSRAHGNFTGHARFKTLPNAQRWCERRLAKRGMLGT